MKNDLKTTTMIMQLEHAAMQVFNQYAENVRDFIPAGPMNLHTILHKRPEGNRINPTVADLIRLEVQGEAERLYGKEPETIDHGTLMREYYHHYTNYQRLLEIKQRHDDWMAQCGFNITIEGDGYRMSFPKWEAFRILENMVHASNYPTSKLLKYAIA